MHGVAALTAVIASEVAVGADSMATAEVARARRAEAVASEYGEGVPRDQAHAAALYCECARNGDSESQFRLGWMYANGRGVPRDDGLASYFFLLAAAQGNADAERMLRHVGREGAPPPPCMTASETLSGDDAETGLIGQEATSAQRKVIDLVHRLAPQYGINPRLALAVIRAESNFDPTAVSSKNARGLMQLIPETAVRFNVKKPFDPEQNIRGGLSYLRWLLAYFKGNVTLVAAAYNAGEGAVNQYRGVPPYSETRGYVKRIRELFHSEDHPYDPKVVDPSPEMPRIRARLM